MLLVLANDVTQINRRIRSSYRQENPKDREIKTEKYNI